MNFTLTQTLEHIQVEEVPAEDERAFWEEHKALIDAMENTTNNEEEV